MFEHAPIECSLRVLFVGTDGPYSIEERAETMSRHEFVRVCGETAETKRVRDLGLVAELLKTDRLTDVERAVFVQYKQALETPNGKLNAPQRKKIAQRYFDLGLGDADAENLISSGKIAIDEPIEKSLVRMFRHIPERFRHPLSPPKKSA